MNEENTSYGLILEPIQPEDYRFGSSLQSLALKFGGNILVPDGDWRKHLFDLIYSHQAPGYETNSCVTHGTLNCFELMLNAQYGRIHDFSDRFLASVADTDPTRGATPKQIGEAFRKKFSVFEREWPTSAATKLAEFYAPIPASLTMLAVSRGVEWDIGYEYVNGKASIKEALKYSPIGMSVPAWSFDEEGHYYRPAGKTDNHWVTLLHIDDKGYWHILDSYKDFDGSFLKVLRADFEPTVAMRYHLTRQVRNEKSWLQYIIDVTRAFFNV